MIDQETTNDSSLAFVDVITNGLGGLLVLKQAIACLSESDFRSAAATEPAGLV